MNLILIRHGQSEWNALNQFTGWKDPGLTAKGIEEAHNAGKIINSLEINFDLVFTSALIRAQNTAEIILVEIAQSLPTIGDPALYGCDYGTLAGLHQGDAGPRWGDGPVHLWRRSYDVSPPGGASLLDTSARVLPFFMLAIHPPVCSG
jgi:phosphoglycerate mutase, BPG-dependent, family 1